MGAAAFTRLPVETEIGKSESTIGPEAEKMSENPALSSTSSGFSAGAEVGGGGTEGGAGRLGGGAGRAGGGAGLAGGGTAGLVGGGLSGFSAAGGGAGLAGGGAGLGGGGPGLGGGGLAGGGRSSSSPIDGIVMSPNSSKESCDNCDKLCLLVSRDKFCNSLVALHNGMVLAEHNSSSLSRVALHWGFFKLIVNVCPQTSIVFIFSASRAFL